MTLWQLTAWPLFHSFSSKCRIVKGKRLGAPTRAAFVLCRANLLNVFYNLTLSSKPNGFTDGESSLKWTINQLKSCHEKKCVTPQFSSAVFLPLYEFSSLFISVYKINLQLLVDSGFFVNFFPS